MQKLSLVCLAAALVLPAASLAGVGAAQAPAVLDGQVPNEIVISFAGPIPADAPAWLAAHGGQVLMRDDVLHWVSARFASADAAGQALLAAQARLDVASAQRDGYVQALAALPGFQPDDPRYGEQWGFPAIFAPQAWQITLGSHSVKVAMLDTGLQVDHPDIAPNACGPFASFDPDEPTIADGNGHGTHTAGTVAAATNNGVGVAGTSQSCLMAGKVLGASGGGQWTWVAAGIRWAADNGADIISMSLGGGGPPQAVHDSVTYAWNHNVLIVAAAGNSGCFPPIPGTMGYPALYPESLAVAAAMQPNGLLPASFSSCGGKVEIAGPGVNVLSTYHGSGYASLSGTSMATPHVAGVAALVKAIDPGISNLELRCLLDLSATHAPSPVRDVSQGWGLVNAFAALTLDQQLTAQGLHGPFTQACAAGAPVIMYNPLPV